MGSDVFIYSFIIRGALAGLIIGAIAPLIGMFLVLRRYSLIADTLAHVSLAGIAIGLFTGLPPLITASLTTVVSSLFIERLRTTKKIYGESALALFLSGSLALAILLLSISRHIGSTLFSYLFGSISTVSRTDLLMITSLGIIISATIGLFYKELLYISFDEETAQVSGLPVKKLNLLFIILCSIAISLCIPIVGILLISALIVIPTISALQLKKSFRQTMMWSEIFSLLSVSIGFLLSLFFDLPTGATIVLVSLSIFLLSLFSKGHAQ